VARGIGKGDRIAIAMRNCPAWILCYMAALKAGAVATLINGWWQPEELEHALQLVEPKLVIADAPRATRIAATCASCQVETIAIEQPARDAFAGLIASGSDETALPDVEPDDDATILFTSGSTGEAKGALSTHRAVTTGVYAYATALLVLRGILESEGRPPANPLKTLVVVPLFHVTGEVPVLLNSFVISRGMVLVPKWDAGEALRLIERSGSPTSSACRPDGH
jgi:acyl-CoA synthetase (AMP-forming)/AMP-acid ligase II